MNDVITLHQAAERLAYLEYDAPGEAEVAAQIMAIRAAGERGELVIERWIERRAVIAPVRQPDRLNCEQVNWAASTVNAEAFRVWAGLSPMELFAEMQADLQHTVIHLAFRALVEYHDECVALSRFGKITGLGLLNVIESKPELARHIRSQDRARRLLNMLLKSRDGGT